MIPFVAISVTFLLTAFSAAAAPRFALVRIKEIYSVQPSTIAMEQQVKDERAAIMKDPRAEQLRGIISELQTLQAQLADKTTSMDEAAYRELAQTYEIKRQEAQTLQQEFENFKKEQEKIINRKMVTAMRASLHQIEAVSQKVSQAYGFDAVFDSSGETNSSVPFILFAKDAADLTVEVEAALQVSEPTTAAGAPAKPIKSTP
ncbi:MAG: OmpH family outer membrane protein [Luteolibacter sp.]